MQKRPNGENRLRMRVRTESVLAAIVEEGVANASLLDENEEGGDFDV